MPLLIITLFRIWRKLRGTGYGLYTTASAWLVIIAVVATNAFFMPTSLLYSVGIGGLLERILLGIILLWMMVSSWLMFQNRITDGK